MKASYRAEVFDAEGNLLHTVERFQVSTYLHGGSAGTFEPYEPIAATLRITDGDTVLGVFRTMDRAEYDEWIRDAQIPIVP